MFEIGWTELLLIGIVALIVIGPKDLPDMFRTMGRFTAKLRSMARDFQRAMDQAAKETGVNDIAADLKSATSAKSMGLDAVKDAASRFEKWDPLKPTTKPATSAVPATAAAPATPTTPTIHGPATQALVNAQAAKKAITAEAAEKLRALKTGAAAPVAAQPVGRARKSKAVAEPTAPVKPAPKPRAPRKPAKDA
jgi:sec-independent protein translocase protein TatB